MKRIRFAFLILLGVPLLAPLAMDHQAVAGKGKAEKKKKKWDWVIKSPVVVDPDGDWGGYRVLCQALKHDGRDCYACSDLLDCDLSYDCILTYKARRLQVSAGSYLVLDPDVPVNKTIDLVKAPKKDKIILKGKGDRMVLELYEAGKKIFVFEGFNAGGSGSEAGITDTYFGYAKTPGAFTTHADGVSVAGKGKGKTSVVEFFKSGAVCVLREEFLE